MNYQDFVQRGIDAIQSEDAGAYGQLFAEDAVMQHPLQPEPLQGRAAIQESEQVLFDAFSDIEVEVVRVFEGDNSVAVEAILRATNDGDIDMGNGQVVPATGRRIEVPSVWISEFNSEGLVAAERDYFDAASFMAQLGMMEE